MNNELTVKTEELASYLNLTKRRVQQLVEEEIFSDETRDLFNLKESTRSYCEYIRGISRGSTMTKSEKAARVRILEAKANLSEIEAAEKMGLVIRIDAVKTADIKIAITLRESLMGIADRIAPLLAASNDQDECYHLINKEVRRSLNSAVEAMKKIEIDDSLLDLTRLNARVKLKEHQRNITTK